MRHEPEVVRMSSQAIWPNASHSLFTQSSMVK